MIDRDSARSVKVAWRSYKSAQRALNRSRADLVEELLTAQGKGATLQDLGAIMKVSRQRVGQYLKGVK